MQRLRLPHDQPGYQPVDPSIVTNAPDEERLEHLAAHQQQTNSLWQPGNNSFFRDQRARSVGDIVKVNLEITDDSAKLENSTSRTRGANRETMSMPSVLGLEEEVSKIYPNNPPPDNMLDLTSSSAASGEGVIDRSEEISVRLAAIVTQILPNGNLVIHGRQQIRVNYELREISVAGVIRPKDINSDNSVDGKRIAEARISYGGRGQLSDLQQPRWGQQVIDVIAPF